MKTTNAIVAETHGPEYLIHKYWSRKPANVIRELIARHSEPGDLVLDPFCGSGVSILESIRSGRNAVGIDINPIAILISKVSASKHCFEAIHAAWEAIIGPWSELCDQAYQLENGRPFRYSVHAAIIRCDKCQTTVRGDRLSKKGGQYICSSCETKINTSISHSSGTELVELWFAPKTNTTDADILRQQTSASTRRYCTDSEFNEYDIPLLTNKRILAYSGMTTATLFTPRNFSLLARLATLIRTSGFSREIQDVLLLVLSSAAASCSRLIAYRNNMSTGGPAWSVPGFWVPPMHLERNPLHHVKTRFTKMLKGLKAIDRQSYDASAQIIIGDAVNCLERFKESGTKFDYIFADPPYGDSIPFLEFSQIWNCWLGQSKVEFDDEVVVSDRIEHQSRWEEYTDRLSRNISACKDVLSPDGKLTMSFNNLDLKAWQAILNAVQHAKFECVDVVYQIPAVVSAKARFHPTGSYIGDVYATFTPGPDDQKLGDWDSVEMRLSEMIQMRGPNVNRAALNRVGVLAILSNNVDVSALEKLRDFVARFPRQPQPIDEEYPLFGRIQQFVRSAIQGNPNLSDAKLCAAVVSLLPTWYGLDRHEILDVAERSGFRVVKGHWVDPAAQLELSLN